MILQYIEENMFLSILHHVFKSSILNDLKIPMKGIKLDDLIKHEGNSFKGYLVNLFEKDIGGTSIKGLFNSEPKFNHFLSSIHDKIMGNQHSIVEGGKVKLNNLYSLIKDELHNLSVLDAANPHSFSGENANAVGNTVKQVFNPLDHFYGNHELAIKGTGIATAGLASLPIIGSIAGAATKAISPIPSYPSISLPSTSLITDLLPTAVNGAALLGGSYAAYKYLKSKRDDQRIHP